MHKLRAPGHELVRLPLFIWGIYATGMIQVLATPVLAITLVLLLIERVLQIGIFDPAYRRRSGAVPALLLVLFASGGVHHDSAGHGRYQRNHSDLRRKKRFSATGHRVLERCARAVELHRVGPSPVCRRPVGLANVVFSALTFLVAIPSGVKVFNWPPPCTRASISFETPMLYAHGVHLPVHDRRPDRHVSCHPWRWIST